MIAQSKHVDQGRNQAEMVKANLALKTAQAAVRPTEGMSTAQAAARTTQVAVQTSATSKAPLAKSGISAVPPLLQSGDDEEKEDEDDEYDSERTTKTDSMAMPSKYVPPQLKIQMSELPVSLAGTKTMAARPKTMKMLKGAMILPGGKKGKRKKKGKGARKAVLMIMDASVTQGERESLDKEKQNPAGKRKSGIQENELPTTGRQRFAKRRAIVIVVVVVLIIAVAGAIVAVLLTRPKSSGSTSISTSLTTTSNR